MKKIRTELVETSKLLSRKDLVTILNAKLFTVGTLRCVEVKAKGDIGMLPITKIAPLGLIGRLKSVLRPIKTTDQRIITLNEKITRILEETNRLRGALASPLPPLTGLTFVLGTKKYKEIRFAVEPKKVRGGIAEIIFCADPSKPFSRNPIVMGRLYDTTNMAQSFEIPGSPIFRDKVLLAFIKRARAYVDADGSLSIDCYKELSNTTEDFALKAIFGGGQIVSSLSEKSVNLLGSGNIDIVIMDLENGIVKFDFEEGFLIKPDVSRMLSSSTLCLVAKSAIGMQIRGIGKPIINATLNILTKDQVSRIINSIELI